MPPGSLLACIYPAARIAASAVAAAAILHSVLAARRGRLRWRLPVAYLLALLLTLWLGSLTYSPLGFGKGRLPLLMGLRVTRPQRAPALVQSGQTVSLAAGSPMALEPRLLPGPVECTWTSSNGGAFDAPDSCDTAYEPGEGAVFDFLHVRVRSACNLPPAIGTLRVSILP